MSNQKHDFSGKGTDFNYFLGLGNENSSYGMSGKRNEQSKGIDSIKIPNRDAVLIINKQLPKQSNYNGYQPHNQVYKKAF